MSLDYSVHVQAYGSVKMSGNDKTKNKVVLFFHKTDFSCNSDYM